MIIHTKTTGEGNVEGPLQSNGSVNWQFDATVATEVDVDYQYLEYREIENEESDADGMLTVKAANYTRRTILVEGIDSTAQINGNGNTGVDGVGAVSRRRGTVTKCRNWLIASSLAQPNFYWLPAKRDSGEGFSKYEFCRWNRELSLNILPRSHLSPRHGLDPSPGSDQKKGQAQHIAFVLQFVKFCELNRMFLNGDLQ